jgi:hypothetical protein
MTATPAAVGLIELGDAMVSADHAAGVNSIPSTTTTITA